MGRPSATLIAPLALLAASLAGACGDPLVVLGDAPGIARVVAGIGDSIGTRVDSLATRSRFTTPSAVVFGEATQRLYFADRGSTLTANGVTRHVARLFSVQSDGRIARIIDRGGCSTGVCLESAHSMAATPEGDLYISDDVGHRIFRLRPASATLEPVAGSGVPGASPDGVAALGAPIHRPSGLAWVDGRLLFAEHGGHRVRSIEADGTLGTIAGTGDDGSDGDGGAATAARLSGPVAIASDGAFLFVAEREGHRIRQVSLSTGTITTLAGDGTAGFRGDGGPATEARFDKPSGLAVTADGTTLFITDQGNARVRALDLRAGTIATFAGTGDHAFLPGPRQAGDISLYLPASLSTSPSGFLFIADPGHFVVWRCTLRF
ncbi:MAG: hypothetical protein PVH00_06850 [Gemmatimonadota bacterium]|jgi:sugar lactone lactonase YvrE